jgi:trehalose 6-phosphate synthase
MSNETPLVLVSNRGPVTFQPGGEIKRGTGGLVTALIGLASHRPVTWVASAMSEEDVEAAERAGGRPFPVHTEDGNEYRVKLVASEPEAYDGFYNIIANPLLWFIQHYLWDLSNAPDIRRNETEAFEFGYNAVNEDLAHAVLDEVAEIERPVVMVHDYHLYTLPGLIRRERPDIFLHHFVHIPWSQSDSWRVLPSAIRREIYDGILSNDIVGFHTRSYRRNFLQCCEDLMGLEVDHEAGIVRVADREVWVRAYPLPIDSTAVQAVARRPRVREFEGELMPSRTDIAEYAEYLERIEAVVAVVNHRHGSPDWMPIQLKLRDDLEEAVAAYKHYDVLMVNAMFDGMNLVAKEGPMVNERAGVSILSENTGAHEELGDYSLSVNPFDIQELADSLHAALTMSYEERERRHDGLISIVTARDPGDWIDDQLADIRAKEKSLATG